MARPNSGQRPSGLGRNRGQRKGVSEDTRSSFGQRKGVSPLMASRKTYNAEAKARRDNLADRQMLGRASAPSQGIGSASSMVRKNTGQRKKAMPARRPMPGGRGAAYGQRRPGAAGMGIDLSGLAGDFGRGIGRIGDALTGKLNTTKGPTLSSLRNTAVQAMGNVVPQDMAFNKISKRINKATTRGR